MIPERLRAIDELYSAALALHGDERASLLSRADPEVRRTVEAMLAQDATSDLGILDRPAWEAAGQSVEVRPRELAAGAQLGPYRVESVIGAGGMGKVYRARDSRLNREVAIKASNTQFTQRFEREAKTIAALNHPNVCQIYDIGPNYLVMEFVDGTPIVSADRPSPLSPAEALRLAVQIASALEAAHEKGIIHRDLKPANILVTGGVVKLLDFGLAKQNTPSTADDDTQTVGLTQAGTILGTPACRGVTGVVADNQTPTLETTCAASIGPDLKPQLVALHHRGSNRAWLRPSWRAMGTLLSSGDTERYKHCPLPLAT